MYFFGFFILTACSPSREQIAATMAVQTIEARGTATTAIEQAVSIAPTAAATVTNTPLPTVTPTVTPTLTPDFQKTQVSLTATQQSKTQYLADLDPEFVSVGSGDLFVKQISRNTGSLSIGDPIRGMNGTIYKNGLFAHAPSKLTYRLNGEYSSFTATLTMGDAECGDGAWFSVHLDNRRVYYSPVLYLTNFPIEIELDVTGATLLTLQTHVGELEDGRCDWTIWGDPFLMVSATRESEIVNPDIGTISDIANLFDMTFFAMSGRYGHVFEDGSVISLFDLDDEYQVVWSNAITFEERDAQKVVNLMIDLIMGLGYSESMFQGIMDNTLTDWNHWSTSPNLVEEYQHDGYKVVISQDGTDGAGFDPRNPFRAGGFHVVLAIEKLE